MPTSESATGTPGRRSGWPLAATSNSEKEAVTSEARAFAAFCTSSCLSYGLAVSTSLPGLNLPAAVPGVHLMLMPGSVVAGAISVIFFLVVTFQPRDSTLPIWSAAVTAARSRRMSWPAWRTKALWSPSVFGEEPRPTAWA